ncbi:NADPH-dependent glutamate synthase [Chlamydiota bacterium]
MPKKNIPRQNMPEQQPQIRKKNFSEVPLGLSQEAAILEAIRCLNCKNPVCIEGCPVGINIPAFIQLIKDNMFIEAAQKIKEENTLPAVCGRVCPQEDQCELKCILGIKGLPVAIGYLERFVADFERNCGSIAIPQIKNEISKKIAIIGAGPSGLTCAGELRKLGYHVTIFEALHKPGGVLMYGIPEFRLPKSIVEREVDYLEKLGVEIRYNTVIGRTITVDELLTDEKFDAIYIATGAGVPSFMNIPGEDLNYVYSANEFLTRVNLMKAYEFPKSDTPVVIGKCVAVIGGGNTAMDSARCALRLGPEKVFLIYRRSQEEMPARIEEIHHAKDEGIIFHFLTAPTQYISDGKGNVKFARCIRMELGQPDDSGRRRPIPIKASEFDIAVDSVVVAIGTQSNPIIASTTPELGVNKWGYIITNNDGQTSIEKVFAGGDIVSGSATVISAMGQAKTAAAGIHNLLINKE